MDDLPFAVKLILCCLAGMAGGALMIAIFGDRL